MFKFALVILDGFGNRVESDGNAYRLAHTPNLDHLLENYPNIPLETSGRAVGLPDGVMGNSEVGHMNMGAGRIVRQDLVRINEDILAGTYKKNQVLLDLIAKINSTSGTLHLFGLCSDAGVHSHIDHLRATLELAAEEGLSRVVYHALMDGRDTMPDTGIGYLKAVQSWMADIGVGRIGTVCGRYYAMDRDKRWDRTAKAYELYTRGSGDSFPTIEAAMQAGYETTDGDEFIPPSLIGDTQPIVPGDGVLMLNFRADRMRQIVRAFSEPGFSEFPVEDLHPFMATITIYDETFNLPVLYPPEELTHLFPELLADEGYAQLRLAETEKYAHVTYFFNGGNESTFPGEDRELVPSPKVATYDLQPEMSVHEVGRKTVEAIDGGKYEAVICNLANPDMVGHTGKLEAAMAAMVAVDENVGQIMAAVNRAGGALFLTADHGNVEMMINPDTGGPHTAHTTNDVPFVMMCPDDNLTLEGHGKLADIAPTILAYLKLPIPPEMTGDCLLTPVGVPASSP